jgi:hypothetical protein
LLFFITTDPMLGVEALRTCSDFASSPSEAVAFWKEESVRFVVEISYRSNEDFLGTEGVSLTTLTLDTGAEVVRWNVGTFVLVLECWLRRSCTSSEEDGKDADFGITACFMTSLVSLISSSPSELLSNA